MIITLKGRVFEALDNAFENGYDQRTEDPERVVDDLKDYDADLQDVDPAELLPCVRAWQSCWGSIE